MIKKSSQKDSFFDKKNEHEFSATFSELDISNVAESDKLLFEKMQTVFFLGQLLGLPTLKSILVKFGNTSSQASTNYKKFRYFCFCVIYFCHYED
ncbi:hypothetical protein ACE193_23765 [Bernardetia sp. OM2101]|uniref:hypothetical protein n=1 Tax=Bernardetia sp. OM2101 TaxID=3344876 RepID=UPI0035D0BA1F